MYPLAVDLNNNLIAHNGEETQSLAIIENYITGERELLKVDFLPAPYPGHSIDSISLSDHTIFIEWKNSIGKLQRFEVTIK